jgi:hypothetical protein
MSLAGLRDSTAKTEIEKYRARITSDQLTAMLAISEDGRRSAGVSGTDGLIGLVVDLPLLTARYTKSTWRLVTSRFG